MLSTRKDEGDASTDWIRRMALGMGLIGLSLWGIALCQGIFRTFMAPDPSPTDTSFARLAAGIAWFVFFGPIAVAGLAMLWVALRKLSAPDWLEAWCEERLAQVYGLQPGGKPHNWRFFRGEEDFHDGLESLSDEKVARLKKMGYRAAILVGLSSGTLLVVIGACGLTFVSSSLHVSSTVSFAVLSGISILAGLTVLQRTLRKENNAWLFPLRLFTRLVLWKHRLSGDDYKNRPSEHVR